MQAQVLPLPQMYNPRRVGQVFHVDYENVAKAAREWATEYGVLPAGTDSVRTAVLGIDIQNAFASFMAELPVTGRSGNGFVMNGRRTCELLYKNLAWITK